MVFRMAPYPLDGTRSAEGFAQMRSHSRDRQCSALKVGLSCGRDLRLIVEASSCEMGVIEPLHISGVFAGLGRFRRGERCMVFASAMEEAGRIRDLMDKI
jgi:hypothetical protein